MTACFTDGREEVLLNVPKYDFAWQTDYTLAQPLTVPKGTRFVWEMTWDNSPQTWDEMGIGFFGFRYVDETAANFLADRAAKEKQIEDAKAASSKIASAQDP